MISSSEAIHKYFPDEKPLRTVSVELIKSTTKADSSNPFEKIFFFSFFRRIKPVLTPQLSVIETERYWFIDLRYTPSLLQRGIFLLCYILLYGYIYFTFRNILAYILSKYPIPVVVITILSIGWSFYRQHLQIDLGGAIEVYKKEWVTSHEENKMLKINIIVPSNEKFTLFYFIPHSKLINFLLSGHEKPTSFSRSIDYEFKKLSHT